MQIGVESSRAVENRRIFILDDDEIIRAALQFMLHDENAAHELGSMEAALDKARTWAPDLLLLGQTWLQAQGIAALERLLSELPGIPVLLVGDQDDGMIREALAAGASALIPLPLRLESVRASVDASLQPIEPS
jgi:DNA-binding NarL/FixJ family response regulator